MKCGYCGAEDHDAFTSTVGIRVIVCPKMPKDTIIVGSSVVAYLDDKHRNNQISRAAKKMSQEKLFP